MKKALGVPIFALLVLTVLTLPSGHSASYEPTDGWVEPDAYGGSTIAAPPASYAYRDYPTIRDTLYATEADHPDISSVFDIGDSWETTQGIAERDILAVKISDNVEVDEDEPEILIMSLHHAREWPGSEITMQLVENLTDLYGSDARISWLVDNREIWIVPVVNPDGLDFALNVDEYWRKNRRDNGDGTFGVDLNRNYNGSENGDPLGAWGGAGTSNVTSDSTYCGEYPFSEPETQAIRDLALNHSFTVAIDFHTYSDLVMWPWGYTEDAPPDNDDLVRIGNSLAALNGYTADQSVGLYPTTGDSLDWLYGGVDIYAFLFEVGGSQDGFHPDQEDAVLGLIAENIPPALLLIEIAGDREERQFEIQHEPLQDELYTGHDREALANITAARGLDESATELRYSVDGGAWHEVTMAKGAENDTYTASIPSQPPGSVIDYYIVARDVSGVELMSPRYAPYEAHSFLVLVDATPPVADAGSDITVPLGWLVSFDGSGSSDDVGIANMTWSFVYNGSTVELYGETPHFVFWTEGVYTVTLTVLDPSGNSDTDEVVVTVDHEVIPEFGGALLPVAMLLLLFGVLIRSSRAHKRSDGAR